MAAKEHVDRLRRIGTCWYILVFLFFIFRSTLVVCIFKIDFKGTKIILEAAQNYHMFGTEYMYTRIGEEEEEETRRLKTWKFSNFYYTFIYKII